MAIADTIIPVIDVSSASSDKKLTLQASEYRTAIDQIRRRLPAGTEDNLPQNFLQENASSVAGFREHLQRTLGDYVREDARKGMRIILSALE